MSHKTARVTAVPENKIEAKNQSNRQNKARRETIIGSNCAPPIERCRGEQLGPTQTTKTHGKIRGEKWL